jgi:xanthosine utilization system XapX-like protein
MTEPHHTATDRPLRTPSRVPGVVALCGLGLLGILGYVLTTMVPRQRAAGMVGWRDRLSALAEDRGSAIDDVIRHVSADAAVLSRFPSLIRYLGHRTPDPAAAHHLDEVFRTVLVAHGYEAALVLDHEGVTRLTVSADGRAAGAAACGGMAVAALRAGSGPHFTALVDGRRMACFAADVTEDHRHLGVVVLAIDPAPHLYSLLASRSLAPPATALVLIEEIGGVSVAVSPLGPGVGRRRRGAGPAAGRERRDAGRAAQPHGDRAPGGLPPDRGDRLAPGRDRSRMPRCSARWMTSPPRSSS